MTKYVELKEGQLRMFRLIGRLDGDRMFIEVLEGPNGDQPGFETSEPWGGYSAKAEEAIRVRFQAGTDGEIDHLLVRPSTAIRLFFEGVITREQVEGAEIEDEKIILSGVVFQTPSGTRAYRVKVAQMNDRSGLIEPVEVVMRAA